MLRTAVVAAIQALFKVTHTAKSSSGGWRGPTAAVSPLASLTGGEVTHVAAYQPVAGEPTAAAMLIDGVLFATAIGRLRA